MESVREAGSGERVREPLRTTPQCINDEQNPVKEESRLLPRRSLSSEDEIWRLTGVQQITLAGIDWNQATKLTGVDLLPRAARSQPASHTSENSHTDMENCDSQCLFFNDDDSAEYGSGDVREHFEDDNVAKPPSSPGNSSYMSSRRSSNTSSPLGHHFCYRRFHDSAYQFERELVSSYDSSFEARIGEIGKVSPSPPLPPPPSNRDIKKEMSRLSISRTLTQDVEPSQEASCSFSHSIPLKTESPPPPKNTPEKTPEKTPSRRSVEHYEEPLDIGLDLMGMHLQEQYIREYYGHEANPTAFLDDSVSDYYYGSNIVDKPDTRTKDTSEPEDKKVEGPFGRVWSRICAGRAKSKTLAFTDSLNCGSSQLSAPSVLTTRKSSHLLSRFRTWPKNSSAQSREALQRVADKDKMRTHSLSKALWGAASAAAVVVSMAVAAGDGRSETDPDVLYRSVDRLKFLSKQSHEECEPRSLTESSSQTDECGTWG